MRNLKIKVILRYSRIEIVPERPPVEFWAEDKSIVTVLNAFYF